MRGIMVFLAAACAAGLGATGAGAASDELISGDAWRALTAGKTIYYYKDGELFGREYYPDGKGDVIFRFPNGACAEGKWAWADDKFCFAYVGELHCFVHVRRGDEIVVIGEEDGDEQTIGKITDHEPLSCGAAIDS